MQALETDTSRIDASAALTAAPHLLRGLGLDEEMASVMARRLVEADLLGHRSHGLQNLSTYLERLGDGRQHCHAVRHRRQLRLAR